MALSVILFFLPEKLSAKPQTYEDTQGRFSLKVPIGWQLAPKFGDIDGIRFRRPVGREGDAAWFSINVLETSRVSLGSAAKRDAEGNLRSVGWRAKGPFRKISFGSFEGMTRMYHRTEPDSETGARAIQVRWVKMGNHVFRGVLALPRAALRLRLAQDLTDFMEGIRPNKGRSSSASAQVPEADLIGTWISETAGTLELKEDGRFALSQDGTVVKRGQYRVTGNRFIMVANKETRFGFSLDSDRQTLRLRSPKLGESIKYVKHNPAASKKLLLGQWKRIGTSSGLLLVFRRDQSFQMGRSAGQWQISGRRLRLFGEGRAEISYRFQVLSGHMTLSSGDLPGPINFRKIPGP